VNRKKSNRILLKIVTLSCFSAELFSAPSAVYLEIGAGLGLEDSLKSKSSSYVYEREYIASVAIGYQADLLRFELEGIHKKDRLYSVSNGNLGDSAASGDLSRDTQMFNLYYNGYNKSKLVSSIGAGVGISSIKMENLLKYGESAADIQDDTIFSYQGMFSIGYMLSQKSILTTKYIYFHTQESDNFKEKNENIFSFSYRYLF